MHVNVKEAEEDGSSCKGPNKSDEEVLTTFDDAHNKFQEGSVVGIILQQGSPEDLKSGTACSQSPASSINSSFQFQFKHRVVTAKDNLLNMACSAVLFIVLSVVLLGKYLDEYLTSFLTMAKVKFSSVPASLPTVD